MTGGLFRSNRAVGKNMQAPTARVPVDLGPFLDQTQQILRFALGQRV